MPIINIKVSAVKSPELIGRIADLVMDKTIGILGKKRDLIAIAIDFVDPDCWIVGGASLSAQGKHSVYLDIKVSDETNTKDEKAAYIAEVFAGFGALLGELHEESYIYVDDVRAAAYGYGGRTQEYRYQHRLA
ncbi:4-oxalocrotonate tautomerase family protein [Massilia atriviolacea]|uniref:4-oxalocrotonate tautomerase family protein n=1 Tax=Massilia atriviolacea TaxID=2495579 RepID=A0A430HNP4_9BURK|nr:4-oxalocrotonate tautomerase family protein [Massilia atriviolacea]RSZ59156.1 4-oxalocrotonate tautomerase family protein [Massilia atriviolacea]